MAAQLHKSIAGVGNGGLLIGAAGNGSIDHRGRNILPHSAAQLQKLQFFNGMELEDPAGLVAQLINNIDMITVCVVNNRLITKLNR